MRRPGPAIAVLCLCLSGCTLVKPVVGAFTGPVVLLSGIDGGCGCHGDGRGLLAVLVVAAAAGAACGLGTGIVSDVQWLCGSARQDPTANWWNPLATNADH